MPAVRTVPAIGIARRRIPPRIILTVTAHGSSPKPKLKTAKSINTPPTSRNIIPDRPTVAEHTHSTSQSRPVTGNSKIFITVLNIDSSSLSLAGRHTIHVMINLGPVIAVNR